MALTTRTQNETNTIEQGDVLYKWTKCLTLAIRIWQCSTIKSPGWPLFCGLTPAVSHHPWWLSSVCAYLVAGPINFIPVICNQEGEQRALSLDPWRNNIISKRAGLIFQVLWHFHTQLLNMKISTSIRETQTRFKTLIFIFFEKGHLTKLSL